MLTGADVPVLGFAAYSGAGKTTLLEAVLPLLRAAGLRVAVIKHAHHRFDVDQPGKDSYRLRKAGASPMLIASARRWVLMQETPEETEPKLEALLTHLNQTQLDLILVEGFKHEAFPKIEVFRQAAQHTPMYPEDPNIIAVISDVAVLAECNLPQLDLNNPEQVAEFIIGFALQNTLVH